MTRVPRRKWRAGVAAGLSLLMLSLVSTGPAAAPAAALSPPPVPIIAVPVSTTAAGVETGVIAAAGASGALVTTAFAAGDAGGYFGAQWVYNFNERTTATSQCGGPNLCFGPSTVFPEAGAPVTNGRCVRVSNNAHPLPMSDCLAAFGDPTVNPWPAATHPTREDYVTRVADTWQSRRSGPSSLNGQPQPAPSYATLKTAADECIALLDRLPTPTAAAADECEAKPILVPGGAPGLGQQAALHDSAVLAQVPDWVRLQWMLGVQKAASGVRSGWYTKKMCTASTGQHCDEFPFYATVEGGPAAYQRTILVLQPVRSADNTAEGTAFRQMTDPTTCGMVSATAAGGPAPDGRSDFLVVPLPDVVVPSFYVCGASG